MPNWCGNNLTVSGPEEDVKKFLGQIGSLEEALKGMDSIFTNEEYLKDRPDILASLQEWKKNNELRICTPWFLSSFDETCVVYDTKWGPTPEVFQEFTEIFSTLEFDNTWDCEGSGQILASVDGISEEESPECTSCTTEDWLKVQAAVLAVPLEKLPLLVAEEEPAMFQDVNHGGDLSFEELKYLAGKRLQGEVEETNDVTEVLKHVKIVYGGSWIDGVLHNQDEAENILKEFLQLDVKDIATFFDETLEVMSAM